MNTPLRIWSNAETQKLLETLVEFHLTLPSSNPAPPMEQETSLSVAVESQMAALRSEMQAENIPLLCLRDFLFFAEQCRLQSVCRVWNLGQNGSERAYIRAFTEHWVLDTPKWNTKLIWARLLSRNAYGFGRHADFFLPSLRGQPLLEWTADSHRLGIQSDVQNPNSPRI